MTPPATALLAPPAADIAILDDEFELDLRVVESLAPLVQMRCDTNDGCGSTCSTSACNSSANDPY